MQKESAYPNAAPSSQTAIQPAAIPNYSTPVPKPPGMLDSFKGGLDVARRYKRPSLKGQEWADLKLTRQQWLEKYPGSTPANYFNWIQSTQRRKRPQPKGNWLQRMMWPLNRLLPRSR